MERRHSDQTVSRKVAPLLGAVALAAAALAGCGGGSGHPGAASTTSSPPPSSSAASGGGSSSAAITADWTTFFNGRTPAAKRIALVQDGGQFASVIDSQVHSVFATAASAKVARVVVGAGGTTATVTYAILEDGTVALPKLTGTAVDQGGTWKVGVASFCGLLALQAGGKTSGLPAACGKG